MNRKQESSNGFGINIGSSSILLIFIVLCLVSFATLAISSAYTDKTLSSRVAERTQSYYEACNQAENSLAQIDSTLQAIYKEAANEETYFDIVGHSKTYAIPISDLQILEIIIEIQYPKKPQDTFYKINSWRVLTTGDLEMDDSLPVFQ